jgi:transposase
MGKDRQVPVVIDHLLGFGSAGQVAIDLHTARRKDRKLNLRHPPLLSRTAQAHHSKTAVCRAHFRSVPLAFNPVEIRMSEPRQTPTRPSKLDPFKGQIVAMLERYSYTAQQILQQLRQQGYAGGYSILKELVRQVRPPRKPAFLMLDFAAGECAQVDWGQYGSVQVGSTRRRLSFFVMVLCYSRMMYLEFTLSEAMEQFLSCHRHALEFFGGSVCKVMIDNLKVGVVRHPSGEKALFNPRYLDFAAHHGFEPVACNVGKGIEKGRVENGVGYVKKNLLAGLEISSFEAIQVEGRRWLDETANVRIHGETHRKPSELFAQEKPLLRPLPVMPYDCAVIRPVGANRCCRIVFDANRYSVPPLYASQKLTLKIEPTQLYIFHNEKLIATHLRCYDRRQNKTNPDHTQELLSQRQKARDQTLLLAFLNLSPHAELFCRKLRDKRCGGRHGQNLPRGDVPKAAGKAEFLPQENEARQSSRPSRFAPGAPLRPLACSFSPPLSRGPPGVPAPHPLPTARRAGESSRSPRSGAAR